MRLSLFATVIFLFAASSYAADFALEQQQQREYESRLAATQAMLSALTRESKQKGIEEILGRANAHLSEAATNAAAKDYVSAKALVEQTNTELKLTLVRIKAKASPENASLQGSGQDKASASELREKERVLKEIGTTRALILAIKKESAAAGTDTELFERSIQQAENLLAAGKNHAAGEQIDATYAQVKSVLSQTKKSTPVLSGSASLEAENLAKLKNSDTPANRALFAKREDSVRSMQTALQRIAQEKGLTPSLIGESEKMRQEAAQRADARQYPEGIALLDQTYLLLKLAVSELRKGAELTASKHFATAAEDFSYEQGRNDDYLNLIQGMLNAQPVPRTDWVLGMSNARVLREKADAAGKAGDMNAALKQIGESTLTLKGILRAAGFPII